MAPTRKKALVPKKGEDLKIMWTEKDMNLFKEDMSEVLNSQLNIRKSCMPKSTLRLCEKALNQLVYYHEMCRSMANSEFENRCEQYDVQEEMNKKLAEVEVEEKKRAELEKELEDLENQLIEAKKINVSKKELLEKRDHQLEDAKAAAEVKKDEEAKVVKASIDEVKVENTKMQRAIGQAENSTKGLKNALEACGSVLKEAPAADNDEEEGGEVV